jgi:hypothetical protein
MNEKKIRSRIESALGQADYGIASKKVKEIAFHMTDWTKELEKMVKFFNSPNKFTDDEICDLLMDFYNHAPAHIVAATEIFLDKEVRNIFK